MKIRCPGCGRNVKIKPGASSASCRHCGASMPLAGMSGPQGQGKPCPVCEAALDRSAQNCPRCGWCRVGESPEVLRRRLQLRQLAWTAPLAVLAAAFLGAIEAWRVKVWILTDAFHHASHCAGMLAAGRADAVQPGVVPAGGAIEIGLLLLHLLLIICVLVRWHEIPSVRWIGLIWLTIGAMLLHNNLEIDLGLAAPAIFGLACAAAALHTGLRVGGALLPFPARFFWLSLGLLLPLLQIFELIGLSPAGALSQDLQLLGARRQFQPHVLEKIQIFFAALLPFAVMALTWMRERPRKR